MDVQVRSDYHVKADEVLISYVKDQVLAGLTPYAGRLMSAKVHLSADTVNHTGPVDIRCLVEVRPTGHEPVVVIHHAHTKQAAIRGGVEDMREILHRLFGRMDQRRPGARTIRH